MIKNVLKTLISIAFPLLLIVFSLPVFAQKTLVVSGYIEDAASGERLISAAIVDTKTRNGTVTNTYGFFSLSITEGSSDLLISYIGYAPQTVSVRGDTTLTVKLTASNVLESVEINAKKQDRIENTVQMSRNSIPIEQIKRMPMLLGEADVLKSLQLLPGVTNTAMGTMGSLEQRLANLDRQEIYLPRVQSSILQAVSGTATTTITADANAAPSLTDTERSALTLTVKPGRGAFWRSWTRPWRLGLCPRISSA